MAGVPHISLPLPSAPGRALQGSQGSRPQTDVEAETRADTSTARPWNVVVWDDPINLMSYVVYVFQRLFGFSETVARTKMLEVHEDGRSVVASVERERAEYYVTRLHGYGLQATMEQGESS